MSANLLSVDERHQLDAIMIRLSERSKHSMSFDSLLRRWGTFVAAVERGYDDSIYEYTNSLAARDLVDEVLSGVPDALGRKLSKEVIDLDARFNAATQELDHPLVPVRLHGARWWFRIPKTLLGELKNDLSMPRL